MNKKLVLGLLINETINWYHVLWWKCSTPQQVKWAYGWTSCLSCSIYYLLIVSYTMIVISFEKQQSCEVLKKKRYQESPAKSCGINKIWFNCPTCNGYFSSNGKWWLLKLLIMLSSLVWLLIYESYHIMETCIGWWYNAHISFINHKLADAWYDLFTYFLEDE
jgi:hypothetical protein